MTNLTFLISLVAAALAAASLVLHVVAPRTKTLIDDGIRDDVDELLDFMHRAGVGVSAPAPAPKPPVAPLVALMLLIIGLGGLAMTPACTPAQVAGAKATAWKCTDPVRAEAVSALTPLAVSGIRAAASFDGKLIDASAIKAMFTKANLLSDAGVLAACVAADAFSIVIAGAATAPQPGAAAAAPLEIDPGALRKVFDELRAEQFPGATFETAHGEI